MPATTQTRTTHRESGGSGDEYSDLLDDPGNDSIVEQETRRQGLEEEIIRKKEILQVERDFASQLGKVCMEQGANAQQREGRAKAYTTALGAIETRTKEITCLENELATM